MMSVHSDANHALRGNLRKGPLLSRPIDWRPWRIALAATVIAASTVTTSALDHPLIDAAKRKDLSSLRALLDKHADPNVPQGDGATALHWAAHWDDLKAA